MKNRYIDFRTNFDVHPTNGDLIALYDNDAISNQIRNLIFTEFYEIQWNPTLGGGILGTLFENYTEEFEYNLIKRVKELMNKYVDRINLNDVILQYDDQHSYTLTIVYTPINEFTQIEVSIILKRMR